MISCRIITPFRSEEMGTPFFEEAMSSVAVAAGTAREAGYEVRTRHAPGVPDAATGLNLMVSQAYSDGVDYTFFHAADDTMPDEVLKLMLDAASQWQRDPVFQGLPDVVYGVIGTMDEQGVRGKAWFPPAWNPDLFFDVASLPGAALIHTSVWARAGGFPALPYGSDWAMLARAHSRKDLTLVRLDEITYWHRQHTKTESYQARTNPSRQEELHAILATEKARYRARKEA